MTDFAGLGVLRRPASGLPKRSLPARRAPGTNRGAASVREGALDAGRGRSPRRHPARTALCGSAGLRKVAIRHASGQDPVRGRQTGFARRCGRALRGATPPVRAVGCGRHRVILLRDAQPTGQIDKDEQPETGFPRTERRVDPLQSRSVRDQLSGMPPQIPVSVKSRSRIPQAACRICGKRAEAVKTDVRLFGMVVSHAGREPGHCHREQGAPDHPLQGTGHRRPDWRPQDVPALQEDGDCRKNGIAASAERSGIAGSGPYAEQARRWSASMTIHTLNSIVVSAM